MAKSVLMCLNPARVLSLESDATYVIQKNPPSIKPPFKVYVYMSSGGYAWQKDGWSTAIATEKNTYDGTQKIVGEFFCSEVKHILTDFCHNRKKEIHDYAFLASMKEESLAKYLENRSGYAWKVENFRFYDTPLTIVDFGIKNAPSTWTYVREPDAEDELSAQVFAAYCNAAAASNAYTHVVSAKNLAELLNKPVFAVRNVCRALAEQGLIERAHDKWYNSYYERMCYVSGYRLTEKGRDTEEFRSAEKAELEALSKLVEGENDDA